MGTPSHFWFLLRVLIQRKINVFNLCCYHIVHFFYLASENTQLAQNQKFSLATRLVAAGWCLAAIVFVNSYSSSLVSYLMAPRYIPLMNTIQDLADSNVIHPFIRKDSFQSTTVMVSNAQCFFPFYIRTRMHCLVY